MGKTRDLFKKIREIKGTFHAKMGTIMERNGRDLTEAEDIKKRWQEYTEELYKKDLHDPDNHNGVITHLESHILDCKVEWALGSISMNKDSGGNGIPAELFQILKIILSRDRTKKYHFYKSKRMTSEEVILPIKDHDNSVTLNSIWKLFCRYLQGPLEILFP